MDPSNFFFFFFTRFSMDLFTCYFLNVISLVSLIFFFLTRPSSSSARGRTYSGSQRQMRCGSSTRSIRYDEWPFIYWFTHCSPSSLSLQYWLTAYSWSCPLRPPSSLRSEYLVRSLRPRSSETMTRKLDLLFAYVHRSLFTVFFYFSREATAITYRYRSLQKKKLLFFLKDKNYFLRSRKNWKFPIFFLPCKIY